MSYKFSLGERTFDDITAEVDAQANTKIDFEEDYIGLVTAGSSTLVVSGSMVGIGTNTPDAHLSIDGTQPKIKFTESGQNRAEIFINDSDNLKFVNRCSNKHMVFEISDAGTLREGIRLRAVSNIQGSSGPEVVINDGSTSLMDFRVESDNSTHMIYVDGANDKVGINNKDPQTALDVDADAIRLRIDNTPSSATDFGHKGEIRWDANYIYICVATDTWKRVALSSW